jgi:hypothetical protein
MFSEFLYNLVLRGWHIVLDIAITLALSYVMLVELWIFATLIEKKTRGGWLLASCVSAVNVIVLSLIEYEDIYEPRVMLVLFILNAPIIWGLKLWHPELYPKIRRSVLKGGSRNTPR